MVNKMTTDEEIINEVKKNLDDYSAVETCDVIEILMERLKQARADELARIIELAEEFRCCPFCGNTKLDSHWCPKCKKPFAEHDDAYRFAMHLKEKTE